ncbi:major tail protein [Arthrobacter phage Mufasa8]|uniref:Major tail protein n=1 Tax=Arthrobacter phage Mufasa8 TaxID=2656526 RepID=A0A649VNE1_9CAUD|nr:major tail protein [Arthrobacter phage Mufasa8]QGJ93462.1 major tail protein [Arthrobacter phage Mufasa8]
MAFNFYPGSLQWLGIAKETTYGVAVAAPTIWIPTDGPKWSPKVTQLTDNNLRGFMGVDYGQQNGTRYDEVSYKTYIYPDSVFSHFRAILGGTDTVTGAADPYSHKVSLTNGTGTSSAQPPSYTVFLYMGNGKSKQIPGCVLGDLKFNGKANELPSIDVTWTGLGAADINAPTNTPTTAAPMPPSSMAITIGGANLGKYSDISVAYKRDVKPILTLNGATDPQAIFAGPLSVSGSMTAVFQGVADTDLTNLFTNTMPALSIVVSPSGDAIHTFTQSMSKVSFNTADPQPSTTDWMTIQSTFAAIMNSTDATDGKQSPASATLLNTAATAL